MADVITVRGKCKELLNSPLPLCSYVLSIALDKPEKFCDCGARDKDGNLLPHQRPTYKFCLKNPNNQHANPDSVGGDNPPGGNEEAIHTVSLRVLISVPTLRASS
jgi:hypothetical protein